MITDCNLDFTETLKEFYINFTSNLLKQGEKHYNTFTLSKKTLCKPFFYVYNEDE
jgi:hypothetical protein